MTELDLYRFIQEYDIEWHWFKNNGEEDVTIAPNFSEIQYFHEIVTPDLFDDGGIECYMMDGYFTIWMQDICDYYGIDINNVFRKEGEL